MMYNGFHDTVNEFGFSPDYTVFKKLVVNETFVKIKENIPSEHVFGS